MTAKNPQELDFFLDLNSKEVVVSDVGNPFEASDGFVERTITLNLDDIQLLGALANAIYVDGDRH